MEKIIKEQQEVKIQEDAQNEKNYKKKAKIKMDLQNIQYKFRKVMRKIKNKDQVYLKYLLRESQQKENMRKFK